MLIRFSIYIFTVFFITANLSGENYILFLRNHLAKAQSGDFIVTAQAKNYNLLHVQSKTDQQLVIEEISIPAAKVPKNHFSWRTWATEGAPGNSSRVSYTIDLASGQLRNYLMFSRGAWHERSPQNNFLSTLLNLPFNFIPPMQRRKVGTGLFSKQNTPSLWQPKIIVDGQPVEGIQFDAWKTIWPKDGSDLSGKTVEIYTPEAGLNYPSYFPYWLQISGMTGSAKIRIVDSGVGLQMISPFTPKLFR